MAFDPNAHFIDPTTGFVHDRDTGHPTGLFAKPIARVSDDQDFPKWVVPHVSHIHQDNYGNTAVPRFPEFHVRREDGAITVLVHDADEEALALADAVSHEEII